MITLHRLGHKLELFHLNPDLIVTVEGHPDTVITLATGAKIVVAETPQRVCQAVKAYRVDVMAGAMKSRQDQRESSGGTVSQLRPAAVADQADLI
jgi:flagellar protein FlbD